MHVGDLDRSTVSGRRWTARVTITVHDAAHNPVNNARVTGAWSAGATGSSSCTTGSAGTCTVSKSNIPSGTSSVTFRVTSVTKSGYSYVSGNNHDPETDSNGTTIKITKP